MLASKFTQKALAISIGLAFLGTAAIFQLPDQAETRSVIVQGADLAIVKSAVEAVGGEITHELGIIRAVGARLTAEQQQALADIKGVSRLYENHGVSTSSEESGCSVTGNVAVSTARRSSRRPSTELNEAGPTPGFPE